MTRYLVYPAIGIFCSVVSMTQAQTLEECTAETLRKSRDSRTIQSIRDYCQKRVDKVADELGTKMNECLEQRTLAADDAATAGSVRKECNEQVYQDKEIPSKFIPSRSIEMNPDVISPLRQNYILPYTYNKWPNNEPYEGATTEEPIESEEAKLQISLKVPLTYQDLFLANDGVYFGFTLKSFWQVYNDDVSAPFRETNYRPEFYYRFPLLFDATRGTWLGRIGFEHESNGRSQPLSRSWNRAYVMLGYAENNWALAIQPWYRFPEDRKKDDGDPNTLPPASGDDNPDIEDYMGNYEVTGAYRWGEVELSGLFRRNFSEGHGAQELGLSFPLWGRLRGYAQYFEGYGESLIDYNHRNRRIGLGVLLTEFL